MGSLPRVSAASGERHPVTSAPLTKHLARLAHAQETALVYSDEICNVRISYAELEATANALSKVIAKRARPTGSNMDGDFVIAVCMQPTHNTVMTLLAIWKAGAAYVPMEPSFPQARVSHILNDAEPSMVIHDDSANPALFSGSSVPIVSFEELLLESSGLSVETPKSVEVLAPLRSDSIAIVLYTSGSTGVPKGVRLSYDAICNRLWWQFSTFPYSNTEKTCVWKTSLTFVDSISEMWGPLLHGRTLVILSKEVTRDPQKLVNVLAENEVQRLVLVPTLLRSILMYLSLDPSKRPLKHLKLWVCSGETLSKELAGEFFHYFGDHSGYQLANFYGSTEVLGDVTYHVLETKGQLDNYSTIPIGAPIHNCAVYLLDDEMNVVREGEIGELWVSGKNLASGYVGGQAPEKFCDNPHGHHPDFSRLYRTGDFGVLQKGVVLFAGRTDSQVKIRGHRVDLLEVERAVSGVCGVEKCVVLCYGLAQGNPEILAFVTLREDARLASHHIEASLKNVLTHYMIPQVIVIDSVPLLVNGKVDRQALLKMYENTNNNDDSEIPLDIDYTGVEPEQMETATVLFTTVGEVLGRAARAALSVRAGFYELGGNSLNSIYTITRLRDRGYYIQISDFLGAANMGEVLSKLSTNPDCEGESNEPMFQAEPMRDEHKQLVIDMIVSSFYEKAELEQFLKKEIAPQDYAECIGACWDALLAARLSVILTDGMKLFVCESGICISESHDLLFLSKASGSPVAVALNFDARDEPEIDLSGGLAKIMAFLEHVEGLVRDTMLPEGKGAILHSFMMATASTLNARDNVAAIRGLEHATISIARDRRFQGIFTTNTSPLTQQLGTDVLGFTTLLDYQINHYVDSNGERVFGAAPDDMRAVVCWKPVD